MLLGLRAYFQIALDELIAKREPTDGEDQGRHQAEDVDINGSRDPHPQHGDDDDDTLPAGNGVGPVQANALNKHANGEQRQQPDNRQIPLQIEQGFDAGHELGIHGFG